MAKKKDIEKLFENFLARGIPGGSLHVLRKGKTLFEGYFGVMDVDTKQKVDRRSLFRQASMSKIPLYTAMMMLFEQGKFLMTDPVGKYLPAWSSSKKYERQGDGSYKVVPTNRPITMKDVMTMRCGLPYCNFDGPTEDRTLQGMQECMRPLWKQGHFTVQEQMEAVSKAPLQCEPGEQWIYGFSSEIAAGVAEAVCDKPINDVLQQLLYDPLEMENTGAVFFGDTEERLVTLYAMDENGNYSPGPDFFDKKHLPGEENEGGWGRIFTNGEDFSKLMQMLACGGEYRGKKLMGRKTIDLMRSNTLGEEGFGDAYNAGYGYGYGVRTLIDKARGNHNGSLGAFGWTGAFGTWCEADPSEGLSIVYMHNLIPDDEEYCHPRIRAAAYGLL